MDTSMDVVETTVDEVLVRAADAAAATNPVNPETETVNTNNNTSNDVNDNRTVSMDISTTNATTTAAADTSSQIEPPSTNLEQTNESSSLSTTEVTTSTEAIITEQSGEGKDDVKQLLKRKLTSPENGDTTMPDEDEAVPAKQMSTSSDLSEEAKTIQTPTEKEIVTTTAATVSEPSTQNIAVTKEPPPDLQALLADDTFRSNLLTKTNEQLRKQLCVAKLASLSQIRSKCISNLTEQFYLEQNLNYLDYEKWRSTLNSRSNPFVQNYIEKNYENHATIYQLEQSVIAKFGLSGGGPLVEQTNTTRSAKSSMPHTLSLTKLDVDKGRSVSERAKHEAHILKRIAELRKDGLWSLKRLPKLVEPTRPKTHWDYLLDEMSWMATDFQQERKWKINCCRKLSLAVQKHFREKQLRADLAEKEESRRLRKQAQLVAREINQFWKNIEKIVKYKQNTLLEEKRKETMSLRLNMIVDQTEKYSSWLMESFNQPTDAASTSTAVVVAPTKSSLPKIEEADTAMDENSNSEEGDDESDTDAESESSTSDNESTIEAEENENTNAASKANVYDEIERLRLESELPLEDLLKDYKIDQSYFNKENQPIAGGEDSESDMTDDEDDTDVSSGDMTEEEDDEETIEAEEKQLREKEYNVQNELDELNADNSLSLEELLAKFAPRQPASAAVTVKVTDEASSAPIASSTEAGNDTNDVTANDTSTKTANEASTTGNF